MPHYLTRESLERLREKVNSIQMRLKIEVAQELAKAAAFKDLSENAEWDAALELQANLKNEASKILDKLQDAAIIEELSIDGSCVTIGTKVTLFDQDREEELTYKILGEEESDLPNGVIAFTAPLSRGLLQKEEGDEVSIKLPGGVRNFEILAVEKIDFKDSQP